MCTLGKLPEDAENRTFPTFDLSDQAKIHESFEIMESMRKERLLCDVILSVGNVEVPAHKMVLAASSRYFYANLVLSKENEGECCIALPSTISPEALMTLVNYMYNVKIQITEENVEYLLPAAHTFMLNAVIDNCCKVLLNQLTPEDCFRIKLIAEKYECLELLKKIQHYINNHFSEIIETEQFRTLQFQQLSLLISRDTLTSPAEEKLFEAVMYWLKHDLKERKKYLTGLMQHLRLPLISVAYIAEHIANEPLLKGDLKSKDFIIEAFQHHFLQNKIDAGDLKIANKNDAMVLAVIGGTNSNASKTMEYFDFETGQWSDVIGIPREFFGGAITIDNKIFVLGKDNSTNAIFEYNVSTNLWFTTQQNLIDINPLISGCKSSDFFIANNCIFIASNSFVAKYNISTRRWSTFPFLSPMITGCSIAVIGNRIFVIGGSNVVNSIHVYDENWKCWNTLLSHIPIRHNMGIGVIDQTIYTIGGVGIGSIVKKVETFDVTTSYYKQVASLNLPRRSPGVITFNNLLYVIGGYDGQSFLSSIEVYDPNTNIWTLLPASMSTGRENPAVTLVNKTILKDVSYRH